MLDELYRKNPRFLPNCRPRPFSTGSVARVQAVDFFNPLMKLESTRPVFFSSYNRRSVGVRGFTITPATNLNYFIALHQIR